jgi:hypothetical protein
MSTLTIPAAYLEDARDAAEATQDADALRAERQMRSS